HAQVLEVLQGAKALAKHLEPARRNFEEAVRFIRNSDQPPHLPGALLALADCLRLMDRRGEAWKYAREALVVLRRGRITVSEIEYHVECALLELDEGHNNKAKKHLKTARTLSDRYGYRHYQAAIEMLRRLVLYPHLRGGRETIYCARMATPEADATQGDYGRGR